MRPAYGGSFTLSVGWRIAVFAGLSLAYPAIAKWLLEISNCARVENACTIAGVLGGTLVRPILVVVLVLALLRPVARRARAIGGSGAATLLVAGLTLLDWQYLSTLGSPRSLSLDLGLLNLQLPFYAILAAMILIALAVAPPLTAPRRGLFRRHGSLGVVAVAGIVATLALGAASVALYSRWAAVLAKEGLAAAGPYYTDAFRAGRAGLIACLITMIPLLAIIVAEALRRRPAGEPQ